MNLNSLMDDFVYLLKIELKWWGYFVSYYAKDLEMLMIVMK